MGKDGIEAATREGETGKEDGIAFREAALRLGLSEKTLRARIRSGAIKAAQVDGKRGREWRVFLPPSGEGDREEGREQYRPSPLKAGIEEGRDREPLRELYTDLLTRHEAATVRLGYLQAREEERKALSAETETLRERAARAESQAARLSEDLREAEERAERLAAELGTAKAALEERSRGFFARLFGLAPKTA